MSGSPQAVLPPAAAASGTVHSPRNPDTIADAARAASLQTP